MPIEEDPIVGAVYENEDGKSFEVIAFDENEGVVEVQYEDGTVDEIDIDTWYGMELEQMESEDDEDDVEGDDADYEDDYEDDDDADIDEEDDYEDEEQ